MVARQDFFSKWMEIIKKSTSQQQYKREFVEIWLTQLNNCPTHSTITPVWLLAILEQAGRTASIPGHDEIAVPITSLAQNVIKYYWNSAIYFNLRQGSPITPLQSILQPIEQLAGRYQQGGKPPVMFHQSGLPEKFLALYLKCQDEVSRFLQTHIAPQWAPIFYTMSEQDEMIHIPMLNILALQENMNVCLAACHWRWAAILEKYNLAPRLLRKAVLSYQGTGADHAGKHLLRYLELENPSRNCFFCGQTVAETPGLAHVLPWRYLCTEEIWNMVLAHKSCHSARNELPVEIEVARLEKRNRRLLLALDNLTHNDQQAARLKQVVQEGLLRKYYQACQQQLS